MRGTHLFVALMALLLTTSVGWTQESSYRTADNPFQEEFTYRVPNELRPGVEINKVRFNLLRVAPKSGKSIVPGKSISCTMTVELENLGKRDQNVMIVALLEDTLGRPLEHLEIPTLKVKDGKVTAHDRKFKIDGQILQDTAKIWLFFEVLE